MTTKNTNGTTAVETEELVTVTEQGMFGELNIPDPTEKALDK